MVKSKTILKAKNKTNMNQLETHSKFGVAHLISLQHPLQLPGGVSVRSARHRHLSATYEPLHELLLLRDAAQLQRQRAAPQHVVFAGGQ